MILRHGVRSILAGFLACAAISAWAANPVTWQVALSTTGNDVFWTSPTALTLGYPEYDWSFEITKATANVFLLGDRDLLPNFETTSGSGTGSELPILLVDSVLDEPITNSSAHIRIEVDDQGFGRGSGTDIDLGTVLGLPIRRVDFAATIHVTGIPTGDYDRNGTVTSADYAIWQSTVGSLVDLRADGNRDGVVDAADFTLWRDNLSAGAGAVEANAVPEAASLLMLCCAASGLSGIRVRPRLHT